VLNIVYFTENMFPHWKKSGMGEHKMAKNMFPTYTNRHIFEQSDKLHARRVYIIAFTKMTIDDHLTTSIKYNQN